MDVWFAAKGDSKSRGGAFCSLVWFLYIIEKERLGGDGASGFFHAIT